MGGFAAGPGIPFIQPPLMQMDDAGGSGSPGAGKPKKVRIITRGGLTLTRGGLTGCCFFKHIFFLLEVNSLFS
jgi:hypothetical protein